MSEKSGNKYLQDNSELIAKLFIASQVRFQFYPTSAAYTRNWIMDCLSGEDEQAESLFSRNKSDG